MTNQIILNDREIPLTPIPGTTALRAAHPLKCSICGDSFSFFYHIQIEPGEPSVLICADDCHDYLEKYLMTYAGDYFLLRGIDAPLKMPTKFFTYCRASTPHVTHPSHSLEGQKTSLTVFARDHEFVIADVLQEAGSAEGNRPVFNQMLERIEKGEADAILVQDVSRLARNKTDGRRIAAMLGHGVLAQIVTPAQVFNHSSFLWFLYLQEREREALSRSVKRGLQMRNSRRNLH